MLTRTTGALIPDICSVTRCHLYPSFKFTRNVDPSRTCSITASFSAPLFFFKYSSSFPSIPISRLIYLPFSFHKPSFFRSASASILINSFTYSFSASSASPPPLLLLIRLLACSLTFAYPFSTNALVTSTIPCSTNTLPYSRPLFVLYLTSIRTTTPTTIFRISSRASTEKGSSSSTFLPDPSRGTWTYANPKTFSAGGCAGFSRATTERTTIESPDSTPFTTALCIFVCFVLIFNPCLYFYSFEIFSF
ncbi:hypothetical protein AX774_g265 [Zancudomyces culisetae]|uniref:Uncharacterized protein n=1 Tax=Zancudomyces culisetae TaxID=1213189 RepID=A0A1R1PZ00_ZANCU|nr:hypothetical protein AX774_g265 [Zancudomyces culisetae]|eukprot:OMH86192.1 hypothetical protein AX774_g265 [Zancudomyces culisetae]